MNKNVTILPIFDLYLRSIQISMANFQSGVIHKLEDYIRQLFEHLLSKELVFHNSAPTQNVVKGVEEFIHHLTIPRKDQEILLLAA